MHRKGVTPAGKGVLSIIPAHDCAGIYRERGRRRSIGRVRVARRGTAHEPYRGDQYHQASGDTNILTRQCVKLIGRGPDEAALVEVPGFFTPNVVRLADDSPKGFRKKERVEA